MPLVRYAIQNEYKLGNPEFYRTASKDDTKSMLQGVTMVGLVGLLRQLGDLAEFAAEVFHDLHEEVMATAARGHDLVTRVLQLEAEVPYIGDAVSDSDPLRLSSMPDVGWHATIRNDQNHFTQGDLPRFIRSSYEECRGPPRLFLLDKFDVGAEACLRRYSDPSFFKRQWASTELAKAEKAQRERRTRSRKRISIGHAEDGNNRNAGIVSSSKPKPRRTRYSSLSSCNLDIDNLSFLPAGNQFNCLFRPMDTIPITENNTDGVIVKKAKDPEEAMIAETLVRTRKGQESKQKETRTVESSPKVTEKQGMGDTKEKHGSLKVFSLEKIAKSSSIDSERCVDVMTAQYKTDPNTVKLLFTNNDDENETYDHNLQVRVEECKSEMQETGHISVTTQHFVKTVDRRRHVENSGILQAHGGNLRELVSGVSSEFDIYEDAMDTHSGMVPEAGTDQVINFAIPDKHSEMRTISATGFQYQEDNKAEISPQIGRGSVHIQKKSLFKLSHFDAVGNQSIVQDIGASKVNVSKGKEENAQIVDDAITTKFDPSLITHNQSLTVADIQLEKVEKKSVLTVDHMLNKHVEVLAKEEVFLDPVKPEGRFSWKASEISIDKGFAIHLNARPKNVNSSSDLDRFEDALGDDFDTDSQATSTQELNDICNLQYTSVKTACPTKSFLEFRKATKIEPVQNIAEDHIQVILAGDGWRQGDPLTPASDSSDVNEVDSSYLGKHPFDQRTQEIPKPGAQEKLLHVDTTSASDDMYETEGVYLQAKDMKSKLHGACDGKLSQDDMHLLALVSSDRNFPNDLVSKEQQVAKQIMPVGKIDGILVGKIDGILVGTTLLSDGNQPKWSGPLASVLSVSNDGLVSASDFKVHARSSPDPKSGVTEANSIIGWTKEEDLEDEYETPNERERYMLKTGKNQDAVLLPMSLHVNISSQTNILSNSDAEVVESVSVYSDISGPTSVSHNLGSDDLTYSRSSSDYREDHSVQGYPITEESQSVDLEYPELFIAKPEEVDVVDLIGTDLRISAERSKSARQHKSIDAFLPFISRSPPLSPISSFEPPVGLHKLGAKVRDDAQDYNGSQMDQTAKPKLTIDVTLDGSPAISPIVSPMWSSESPTASDGPQEIFVQGQDDGLPFQSNPLLSSSATFPREEYDFILDAELRCSVGSYLRDAALNSSASSTIPSSSGGLSSGCNDEKGMSLRHLTASPLLSARSSPALPARHNSQLDNSNKECEISMLTAHLLLKDEELLIPMSQSMPSEPSLDKSIPDLLGQFIQPVPLDIKESPVTKSGAFSSETENSTASPNSDKSLSRISEHTSNEAGKSFYLQSMPTSPELGLAASGKLKTSPLPSVALEEEMSGNCKDLFISTEASSAPPAPTPPREPPKSFCGFSIGSTMDRSPGDHVHDIVDSISMSSLSKLRKVSVQAPPKPRNVDDRDILLEQIRSRSFNLRHTTVKKHEPPAHPVPNINVAAILEKAYSMRQAVVGSDEDSDSDGWSDE